jgi:tRNA threonylcarbamoyladenosine biosynthesis protein TsaB
VSVRLALETSTPVGSVAVGSADGGGVVRVEVNLGIEEMHSEVLVPAVDYALATAGATRAQVEEIVVGTGPGSFTGVRIAAAVAKGWCWARDLRLYGYPSLWALAAAAAHDGIVCALLDARRGDVYAACVEFRGAELVEHMPPRALPGDALVDALRELARPPLCVGPGVEAVGPALAEHGVRVATGAPAWPRAAGLLWLRERWPARGRIADPVRWEPLYVRDPGARPRRSASA